MRRRTRRYDHSVSGVAAALRLSTRGFSWSDAPVLLVLLVAVALVVWFFLDGRFYIYGAEVEGNARVSADEVYRASGLDMVSVFYIDRAQVAERLAQRIPGVLQAHAEFGWPSHVRIRIREREPCFVWYTGDTAFLVDSVGRVLEPDDGLHEGLVSVRDLDEQPLQPGDWVDRAALDAARGLCRLLSDVDTFEYSSTRGISLLDPRGWRVYVGDGQELTKKVASMQAVLQKIAGSGTLVDYVDLRFVGSLCYK